jgi:hypothetical protein
MMLGSNPDRGKNFISFPNRPDRLWDSLTFLFSGNEGSFLGVELPGNDFNHSPRTSTEVKNEWSCTPSPPIRLYDMFREIFIFYFLKFNSGLIVLMCVCVCVCVCLCVCRRGGVEWNGDE